jgi:hypothetical protein
MFNLLVVQFFVGGVEGSPSKARARALRQSDGFFEHCDRQKIGCALVLLQPISLREHYFFHINNAASLRKSLAVRRTHYTLHKHKR